MARIRVCCLHCAGTAVLRSEQVLLVPHTGGATYLSTCPIRERVTDAAVGPEHVLLLVAAGVQPPADAAPASGPDRSPARQSGHLPGAMPRCADDDEPGRTQHRTAPAGEQEDQTS